MHGQDEIAALDFEAVDDRLKQALDSLLICQLAAPQLAEELPRRIISVDGNGELVAAWSPTEGLFEGSEIVLGFAFRKRQRTL